MAFNAAQNNYFNFLFGEPEQFQPGRPIPRIAIGMSSTIAMSLKPFKKAASTNVVSGKAQYPADIYRLVRLTDNIGRGIERIDDSKLNARINSVIDPITDSDNPFYIEDADGWNVWPQSMQSVKAIYYRLPNDVKWNSAKDVNGRDVYTANGSVHPEWSDGDCEKILARALGILGFSFQAQSLVQFADTVKATGE